MATMTTQSLALAAVGGRTRKPNARSIHMTAHIIW
jgi:hypothetical protein